VRFYILLINRLYLDAASAQLRAALAPLIERAGSSLFRYGLGALAVLAALFCAEGRAPASPQFFFILLAALALPLFPLQGIYLAALTRAPGYFSVAFALAFPAAGVGALLYLPAPPQDVLRALGALALISALHASIRALGQAEIPRLVTYASIASYALVWWAFAAAGRMAPSIALLAAATALANAGLLLAHQRLRRRYGDLTVERAHGLARPMPRFATVFSLLIMAAVGLPPFGLFFGQVEALRAAGGISWSLAIIALTWFFASWYFFRMMQRLLFGPHRADVRYEDLRANEVAYFAVLIALLLALGAVPRNFSPDFLTGGQRMAMELMPWRR